MTCRPSVDLLFGHYGLYPSSRQKHLYSKELARNLLSLLETNFKYNFCELEKPKTCDKNNNNEKSNFQPETPETFTLMKNHSANMLLLKRPFSPYLYPSNLYLLLCPASLLSRPLMKFLSLNTHTHTHTRIHTHTHAHKRTQIFSSLSFILFNVHLFND
jgi:hypothetical protein